MDSHLLRVGQILIEVDHITKVGDEVRPSFGISSEWFHVDFRHTEDRTSLLARWTNMRWI